MRYQQWGAGGWLGRQGGEHGAERQCGTADEAGCAHPLI